MFEGLDLTKIPAELWDAESSRRRAAKRTATQEEVARQQAENRSTEENRRKRLAEAKLKDQTIPLLEREPGVLTPQGILYRNNLERLARLFEDKAEGLFSTEFLATEAHSNFAAIMAHATRAVTLTQINPFLQPGSCVYKVKSPEGGELEPHFNLGVGDNLVSIEYLRKAGSVITLIVESRGLNQDLLFTFKTGTLALDYGRPGGRGGRRMSGINPAKAENRLSQLATSLGLTD